MQARFGERYTIEREAATGGMGRVYRGRDEKTGRPVAIKVLTHSADASVTRFRREAELLRHLSEAPAAHPAIVGFVDYGVHQGKEFIVLDWVEGETLHQRMRRDPLSTSAIVDMAIRIAEGLAAAHTAGIVHRDIKPANLIITESGDVTIVDFGVARSTRDSARVTRTGMIVGSCAYMAPEQVLGDKDVDFRADIFSLGSVVYEAMAHKRAFAGTDLTAVLARILLDDPTPLTDVAPHVPPAVASVVMRMLAKDREKRFASAQDVVVALRAARDVDAPRSSREPKRLTDDEQRIVSIVLADPGTDVTVVTDTDELKIEERLRAAVAAEGGELSFLADGSILVTVVGNGLPRDQAPCAARCALAIHAVVPRYPIAISMGLASLHGQSPVGAAIDAAVTAVRTTASGSIRVAGLTEGLLAQGFILEKDEQGLLLLGERDAGDLTRTLLGRPTECVGRESELHALESAFDTCVTESRAEVAIICGDAGFGKSRIRYELLRRLGGRSKPPRVLFGRCDPMSAGSAFAPLSDAVRRALSVDRARSHDDQRSAFTSEATKRALEPRAIEMLAEMCGLPFDDETLPHLRAARTDARAMGDAMRAAFEDWLRLESEQPVVFVIEDLHWGDLPSIRFLDAALRNLASRPIFLVALARPEVSDTFPSLWAERQPLLLSLRPLGKKAAAKLISDVLGDRAASVAEDLMARAQGNAFFLEELIRAVADGRSDLPESVIGMVQARLDAQSATSRKVLRAASIFGDRFTVAGVAGLIGEATVRETEKVLADLVQDELVTRHETELRFRHALVRETAYAMLTDSDKRTGHGLAAAFLEANGENDPFVLAEHYLRGENPALASRWLCAAGAQALEGNDLPRAFTLASRAIELETESVARGRIHLLLAEVQRWRGEYASALDHGESAIAKLPRGSRIWFSAIAEDLASTSFTESHARSVPFMQMAVETEPDADAFGARMVAIARGTTQFIERGRFAEADAIIREHIKPDDPRLSYGDRAWVHWMLAMRALSVGDIGLFIRNTEASVSCFEPMGEMRNLISQRCNLAYAYAEIGEFDRAEELLRRVLADAERLYLPMVMGYAMHNLGNVVRQTGRIAEGKDLEKRAITMAVKLKDPRIEGASRTYLAMIHIEAGEMQAAIEEARIAVSTLFRSPPLLALAQAALAKALLSVDVGEAEKQARAAHAQLESGIEDGETFVRLTIAEVLEAAGHHEEARASITAAAERLQARAAKIEDVALRESFLHKVPDSRRTLDLARAWTGAA